MNRFNPFARAGIVLSACLALALGVLSAARAQTPTLPLETRVITTWYKLSLELVRHTPTYSPPVAARTYGYLGVGVYEIIAARSSTLRSLAGQLNGFKGVPQPTPGAQYDTASSLEYALSGLVRALFANTGPSGQRVMDLIDSRLGKELEGRKVPQDVLERSKHYGQSVANAILEWAKTDGGAKIVNMGFPEKYTKPTDPSQWVPTNLIVQQQAPLLPNWGKNRPFVLQQGDSCPIPAPLPYSEDKNSAFYKEALEVYQTNKSLTPEHATIARFWADDPMISTTPPGQWVSVLTQIFEDKNPKLELIAEGYARLGLAVNDAFIGYWFVKYKYNLVRPVTYIQRLIDPKWQPLLNTPPFPEYPSGHSTQSAAVAEALTPLFGENFAYTDHSHDDDNFKPRPYPSFWAAAREAALSRLYGGIHFRRANENRLEMGKCVGMKVNALKFRR